jgi:hypothetical protein
MTDVARKHALERRDSIPAMFWIRVAVAAIFGLAPLWRVVNGAQVVIRDGGALFRNSCPRRNPTALTTSASTQIYPRFADPSHQETR